MVMIEKKNSLFFAFTVKLIFDGNFFFLNHHRNCVVAAEVSLGYVNEINGNENFQSFFFLSLFACVCVVILKVCFGNKKKNNND